VFNNSEGLSLFNVSVFIKKQMENMLWSFAFTQRTTGREYDRVIYKGTINICNVQKGILGNVIVTYFKDNLTPEVSNYKFQCPQPAGEVWIHNFPAMDLKNFPRIPMLSAREDLEFTSTLRAKFDDVKGLAFVLSTKLYMVVLF
jgi:Protein of unknown function (DUF1091)